MEINAQVILAIVAVIGLIYFIFGAKKGLLIFELHFKKGRLDTHKGKVPEKFMREARELAKKHKLTGVVRAEKKSGVRLHVSATINDEMAQRLRNVFPFELYDKKSGDAGKRSA
ncbi:DUF3634 domain-containing protein [Shewanella sp. OPT22]|nr:DUF3634 family protein [Parashewanella hymeniacidonis]MBM7074231.1 DUF3634 family protein [Parashewanella hymeniacidonis]RYV02340.1 DUF3634 domain-containing protein [Shewanella sp. OPT22]